MPRIPTAVPGETDATTAATPAGVQAKLGTVPNLLATLAQSSVALKGYVALTNALAGGRLTARHREVVALAVAQANRCEYCLAAHTALGKGAGLSDAEVHNARSGRGAGVLDNAVALLASTLVRQRGALSNEDLASIRAAGLDDGLIMEIVANVALNALTNYTNQHRQDRGGLPTSPGRPRGITRIESLDLSSVSRVRLRLLCTGSTCYRS